MGRVTGLETVLARTEASVVEMRVASREAALEVGEQMVSDARALAPESLDREDREAGALKESIEIQKTQESPRGFFCIVGTTLFYARFVEYGTERARPFPFMRPAKEKARVTLHAKTAVLMHERVKCLEFAA